VFWFSLQLLYETFLILRRTERDTIRNVYWSSCKVSLLSNFCGTFSQHIYEKCLNIQSHENPCSGGHDDGRTDVKLIVAVRIITNATKRNGHQDGFLHWPSR